MIFLPSRGTLIGRLELQSRSKMPPKKKSRNVKRVSASPTTNDASEDVDMVDADAREGPADVDVDDGDGVVGNGAALLAEIEEDREAVFKVVKAHVRDCFLKCLCLTLD